MIASAESPVRPFDIPRAFGSTGLKVGAIGLGSSYGVGGKDIERAYDRGVNFFLWGSRRRGGFGEGLKAVARNHRENTVIAIQSYSRVGWLMKPFVHSALTNLGTDYVDVLGLAWWNDLPSRRILDAAIALRDAGKVRNLMVSCHHRPSFERFAGERAYDGWMFRYNAAHPGAEREIFPLLADEETARPGTLAFTATRWGSLLDPRITPPGEKTPRASDCYRFALSHPKVDVCLAGPKNSEELDEALAALERGPLDADEMAWMRRVGKIIRDRDSSGRAMSWIDRLATSFSCTPRLPSAPA
ncbi:MAG: aldo/keto reductase [Polyangiaceae bacterium]